MKKQEIKKYLVKIEAFFSNEYPDQNAVHLVKELLGIVENMPKIANEDQGNLYADAPAFPLPNELQNLGSGYAVFSDGACRGNPGI